MQIYIKTPQGQTIAIEVIPSVSTLATVKQILNQKGIDTTDVYFEITSIQGTRKHQSNVDTQTLEQLGVSNQMTILMGSNRIQSNQQTNPIGNQQNPPNVNINSGPPPSFQQVQQLQNQYPNQVYQTPSNQPPQGIQQSQSGPPPPFRPPPPFIPPQPSIPLEQNAKQSAQITIDIETLPIIQKLIEGITTLRNQDSQKFNESLSAQVNQRNYIEKIAEQEEIIRKLRLELEALKSEQKKEISKFNDLREKLENETYLKDVELKCLQKNLSSGVINTARENEMIAQIQMLTQKNLQLNSEIQKLQFGSKTTVEQQTVNDELKQQIQQLEKALNAEHQLFVNESDNSVQLKKQIFDLKQDINIKEVSISTWEQMEKKKNNEIKDLKRQIQILQEDLQLANENFESFKGSVKNMLAKNSNNTSSQDSMQNMQEILRQTEYNLKLQQEQRQQREQQRIKEEEQMKLQLQQERQRQRREDDAIIKKTQEERRQMQISLQQRFKDSHGKMDVCFIVDITGSMVDYKDQAMKCIQGSIKHIKLATNRDASWACVAYQDFAELERLGQYHQIDFTPQPEKVEEFLKKLCCGGGDDGAEDVRGGIKQTCKLNWTKKFKIAILICDAPTHGKIYNGGAVDDHLNEDIRDAIELLIKNEILLIGINFTKHTVTMFNEIQKIYEQHRKLELFLQYNMIGMALDNVGDGLVKLLEQASQLVTKTNERASFSTKWLDTSKPPPTKDGAMEALCKKPHLFDFDKELNVTVVKTKFIVHSVDMKEQAFIKNIQTIQQIRVPEDYVVINEGTWDCIRTTKPFAFGMMKEVYLMKKQNDTENHLYVIKMPLGGTLYPSINEAIKECRSHLICKSLMRNFNRDLKNAMEKKRINKIYPQIQYSDFLILEESPNQFWIAERFFKGEFVKYNNNYGFIDDQGTEMNKLAQAFSYYTYWSSNYNYMINDVQGVGLYFTDPAINTSQGNYDDTDMGFDGQGMYMVAFDGKKHIFKEILDILDIYV